MQTLNQLWSERQTLIGKLRQNDLAIGALFGFGSMPAQTRSDRTQSTETAAARAPRTRLTRRSRKSTGNGLNATAAKVLNAIPPGGATKAEIATASGVSPASVTRTLKGSLKSYVTESGGRYSPNPATVQPQRAA